MLHRDVRDGDVVLFADICEGRVGIAVHRDDIRVRTIRRRRLIRRAERHRDIREIVVVVVVVRPLHCRNVGTLRLLQRKLPLVLHLPEIHSLHLCGFLVVRAEVDRIGESVEPRLVLLEFEGAGFIL